MVTIKTRDDVPDSDANKALDIALNTSDSVLNGAYNVSLEETLEENIVNTNNSKFVYENGSLIGSFFTYDDLFCHIFLSDSKISKTEEVIEEALSGNINRLFFTISDNYKLKKRGFYYIEKREYVQNSNTNTAILVVNEKPVGIEIKISTDVSRTSVKDVSEKLEKVVSDTLGVPVEASNVQVTYTPKNADGDRHDLKINVPYWERYKNDIGEFVAPSISKENSGIKNALHEKMLVDSIIDNVDAIYDNGQIDISEMYNSSLGYKTMETGELRRPW